MRIKITADRGRLVMLDLDGATFVTLMLLNGIDSSVGPTPRVDREKLVRAFNRKLKTFTLTVETEGKTIAEEKVRS